MDGPQGEEQGVHQAEEQAGHGLAQQSAASESDLFTMLEFQYKCSNSGHVNVLESAC